MNTPSHIETPPPQPLDAWFIELLACPVCEQRFPLHLNETQDRLICASGLHAFPIRDGIPDLLAESAIPIEENN